MYDPIETLTVRTVLGSVRVIEEKPECFMILGEVNRHMRSRG